MPECFFCSKAIEKGCGKMCVTDTGVTKWFCSSKCEKNSIKLGRDPRKFKWASKQNKKEKE